MPNTTIIEIEKLNGQNFELWKLKIKYILVDQEKSIVVYPRTTLTSTSKDDYEKLYNKSRHIILVCVVDSVFLNVSDEETLKKLWDKLGNLYQ